ncbi:MAG: Precorrin-3B methylase [Phormidesmis sp.]
MAKSKKQPMEPLEGQALVKETCRRIRAAKGLWDAHRNAACRNEREKAIGLYNQLTQDQKDQVPQQLRVWLRYRSEKYFGPHQTAPGQKAPGQKMSGQKALKPKKRSGKAKKR